MKQFKVREVQIGNWPYFTIIINHETDLDRIAIRTGLEVTQMKAEAKQSDGWIMNEIYTRQLLFKKQDQAQACVDKLNAILLINQLGDNQNETILVRHF
jgi:hypothetical protein